MLPDDLKSYRGDAFSVINPEVAGYILLCALAVVLVLERLGVL